MASFFCEECDKQIEGTNKSNHKRIHIKSAELRFTEGKVFDNGEDTCVVEKEEKVRYSNLMF